MNEMEQTNTKDLLRVNIARAIRGLELAYPLFKPDKSRIDFWASSLMKIDFKPEDILNGAEKVVFSGVEAFKIDLGFLTRACKDAMSERVKREHQAVRNFNRDTENKMLDIQGKSLYAQEMLKLMQEVEKYKNDGKMSEFWDKRKEIMEKYSMEVDEES